LGTVISLCSITVMQKDSIEALHQNQDPLVQKVGLLSLARVFRYPPSKIIGAVRLAGMLKIPKVSTAIGLLLLFFKIPCVIKIPMVKIKS